MPDRLAILRRLVGKLQSPPDKRMGYVPLRFYDQAPNEVVASLHKCSGLLGASTQALLHVQELTRRRSSSR
jgi:hypothetical protein